MSNKEILEKAIQKAIDGGWLEPKFNETWAWNDKFGVFLYRAMREDDYDQDEFSLSDIIYDKRFAMSLWSGRVFSKYPGMEVGREREQPAWQYHLQQMVIAPDPIKYLGQNI